MNTSEKDEGESWLLRDEEMKGGYRETESGLDTSFLWSHDKSEKQEEKQEGWKKAEKWNIMQTHKKIREGDTGVVLLVVSSQQISNHRLLEWKCEHTVKVRVCASVIILEK